MNDQLFAQQLAAAFATDDYEQMNQKFGNDGEHPVNIYAAQSGAITERPCLTIYGEYEQFLHRRKGTVSFEVRSRVGKETAEREHQERFDALFNALLGAQGATPAATLANRAAAKSSMQSILSNLGKVTLIEWGPARDAIEATAEGDDLITSLKLGVVWQFVYQ